MTTGAHPGDDLHRLLDGRLDAERAAQVEAHVAECLRCQRELEAMRGVQSVLRAHLPQVPVPDAVADRVRAVTAAAAPEVRRFPTRARLATAAVLALAAIVVLAIVRREPGPADVVQSVAADYRSFRSGAMELDHRTADAPDLDRFFQEAGVPFPTPVFEFGAMQYVLAGGTVREDDGIRALFAYEGPNDDRMICEMYEGVTGTLPPGAEIRDFAGKRFYIYRVDDLTLVFWQDGEVVCVLVMDGDPEQAIFFARVKAGAA